MLVPPLAWITWGSVERALREGTALPGSKVALPLAVGIGLAGALLLASNLLQ